MPDDTPLIEQECDDCKYARTGSFDGYPVLECHRNPPNEGGWPFTQPDNWCGEWEVYR